MAMKISFESDIKGFSRVEAALTTQKKLIDESAEAMRRFAGAKEGMSKTEDETKGNESLRVTAKRIEDLTGALSTLTKTNSGFKGFIDLFGGFSKQMADFNKGATSQVLDTMTKQIDLLKASITSAGQTLKNVQQEAKQHREAGRTEAALAKEEEAGSIGTKMLGEKSLMRDLQVSKFMHQPVGAFFGGGMDGNGPSLAQIGKGFGKGYALATIGTKLAAELTERSSDWLNSGDRSASTVMNQRIATAQAAASGMGSRMFLQEAGLGREGSFRKAMGATDGSGEDALKGPGSEWSLEKIRLRSLHAYSMFTGKPKTYAELVEERSANLRPVDAKISYAIDSAQTEINKLIRNPTIDAMSRKMGYDGAMNIMKSINAGGSTQDEALPVLRSLAAFGSSNTFSDINAAKSSAPIGTEDYWNDPRAIFSAQRKLGISGKAVTELARQQYYGPDAMRNFGIALGGGSQRSVEAGAMFGEYVTGRQSRFELGGTVASDVSGVAAATIQKIESSYGMRGDSGIQQKVDAITATKAGIGAAEYVSGQTGTAGTLASDAMTQGLHSLGVKNPIAVSQIQQLISMGQYDKAVSLINTLNPKAGKQDIINKINEAASVPFKFAEQLTLNSPENIRTDKALKAAGLGGLAEGMMSGGDLTLGLGLTNLDKNKSLIDAKTSERIISGTAAGEPPKLTATGLDTVATGQATSQKDILDAAKEIAAVTGRSLVDAIAQGFIRIGEEVKASSQALADKEKERVQEATTFQGILDPKFFGTKHQGSKP